jgi:hypothetical protein
MEIHEMETMSRRKRLSHTVDEKEEPLTDGVTSFLDCSKSFTLFKIFFIVRYVVVARGEFF